MVTTSSHLFIANDFAMRAVSAKLRDSPRFPDAYPAPIPLASGGPFSRVDGGGRPPSGVTLAAAHSTGVPPVPSGQGTSGVTK